MENKKELVKEIIRFLIVGVIATLTDYITFYLFNLLILKNINQTVNITISTILGYVVGLVVSWFLQKFVYKKVDSSMLKNKKMFAKYVILAVFGLCLTEIVMIGAKPLYGQNLTVLTITFDFWKLFFKVLMTCIVMVINYFARKYWVFKKEDNDIETKNTIIN